MQAPVPPTARNKLTRALSSFSIVGGIGFAIEAVLLTVLMRCSGWTPWQARVPSFITAVLVTWALNRRHTFPDRGLQRRSLEALSYAAIQAGGALINLLIFGLCLQYFPPLRNVPVVALGIGAIGGFAFNFIVSNAVLYSCTRADAGGPAP